MKFEWNERQALRNARKHRVTFEEAVTVFGNPLSITTPDPEHSEDEERHLLAAPLKPVGSIAGLG
ncbi:MAG TPA: BrnT family toxin [Candidatus Binatia bacterium]|nr:BrnT family toxin [Candidatus Binatia bacterium]